MWPVQQAVKIYYISESGFPTRAANSVHVMKMCAAFAALGHEVVLFARGHGPLPYDEYGVDEVFDYEYVPMPRVPRVASVVNSAALYAAVRRRGAPDVFQGRHVLGLLAVSVTDRPSVYHSHGFPTTTRDLWLQGALFRRPSFAKLACNNRALVHAYREAFPVLRDRQVAVIPSGAEPPDLDAPLAPVPSWPGRPGALQVGYVGHLYDGRGVDVMVELAARLPGVDVHLVGGTAEDLDRWRRHPGASAAHFHGYVPHAELSAYFRRFDVLLAPYQDKVRVFGGGGDTSRWMAPLKVFEYMSYGLPIIASRMPAIEEVLTDGHNALLVAGDRVDEWVAAVEHVRAHPDRAARLGAQARADFLREHTWTARAQASLDGVV